MKLASGSRILLAVLIALCSGCSDDDNGTEPQNPPAPKVLSFVRLAPMAVHYSGYTFASGLFDGDAIPDLAICDSAQAAIYLGRGDGTFGSPTPAWESGSPVDIVVGDFDLDGHQDLGTNTTGVTTTIFLYGDGAGHFTESPQVGDQGFEQGGIALGDVNGDGAADYISVRRDSVIVFLAGAGRSRQRIASYTPPRITTGSKDTSVAADFDGDGDVDIAHPRIGDNAVGVYYGEGNGTFQAPVLLTVATQPTATAAPRSVSSAMSDIGVCHINGTVGVLRYKNGTFGAEIPVPAGASGYGMASADFDADGHEDLVVSDRASNNAVFLSQHADGTYSPPAAFNVGAFAHDIEARDLDGDSKPDVAILGVNTLFVLLNRTQ